MGRCPAPVGRAEGGAVAVHPPYQRDARAKPTDAEAYATVNDQKDTAIKSGWLEVSEPGAFPIVASHRRSLDDVLPFTADEIAGMRRTLAEGTAEQRAAVLAQYQALPENMKDPVAERLVPRAAEHGVMSDTADEELLDGEQYAQANPPRLGGRGGRPSALTARQEMELQFYRSKLDTIRLLEPQNRLLPRVAPENAPISRRQMEEIDRELAEVRARAAQRDLEREERKRGETTSEPLPSADDLVRSTVPGGALSRSPFGVSDRTERGQPSDTPRSVVQTLEQREWVKIRRRYSLNANTPTNRRIIENLDKPVEEFAGLARAARIWRVLPSDVHASTVREVLETKNKQARKLLLQERFKNERSSMVQWNSPIFHDNGC